MQGTAKQSPNRSEADGGIMSASDHRRHIGANRDGDQISQIMKIVYFTLST